MIVRRPLQTGFFLAVAALSGCGGAASAPSPPPAATGRPTPSATAATASTAADDESVALVTTGVGAYLETTVPVAVVRNRAASHSAVDVVVRFTLLDRAGRDVAHTVARIPSLAPGQVGAAAGRSALAGAGDTVRTEVEVTRWQDGSVATITATASGCAGCPARGSGYATVHATLAQPGGTAAATVTAVAVCYDAAGAVAGGGGAVAPAGAAVDVPVIVSRPVVRCEAFGAPGGFGGGG